MNYERLMKWTALAAFSVVLYGVAHPTLAQPVTLTPNQTVADGRLVPVLTWTSSPSGATACTASGGWSGTKAGAGTETLPAITASASYRLDCAWPGVTGVATVSWTAPTTNTDGSSLTNLTGFRVLAGRTATALTQTYNVNNPGLRTTNITGLENGAWFFAVLAVNANGAESDLSNVARKDVTLSSPITAGATANITIRPVPSAPVLTTVTVAGIPFVDVFRVSADGRSINTTPFGMVPVGRECGAYVATYRGKRFHRVDVRPEELWPAGGSTANLAAPCG